MTSDQRDRRTIFVMAAGAGGLANALNILYQNSYVGITKIVGLSSRVHALVEELAYRGGRDGVDQVARAIKKVAAEAAAQRAEAEGVAASSEPHRNIVDPLPASSSSLSAQGGAPGAGGPAAGGFAAACVSWVDVDIYSPAGVLLLRGLNARVDRGHHLIIEGPNGAGKSSLLRVLGGLWPLCSGTLHQPPPAQIAYVPQTPYFFLGSLREQLVYPATVPAAIADAGGLGALDEQLGALMSEVGLGEMAGREGGWGAVKQWGDIFSGGEKQRVAMARLLHRPPLFAVLDEASAAVCNAARARALARPFFLFLPLPRPPSLSLALSVPASPASPSPRSVVLPGMQRLANSRCHEVEVLCPTAGWPGLR
jgi:ABC-type uncharacterized transport system fused permease/ATPase subunit